MNPTDNKNNVIHRYHLYKFWDDEYKTLDYIDEQFNDADQVDSWLSQGYANQFTGSMCDMRSPQPSWNQRFVDMFSAQGWQDIGTSYYRMDTGTVLPVHRDTYKRYVELFDLQGHEHRIRRAIIFLEEWQPGHYAEHDGCAYVNWHAGDVVEWVWDAPHMAANLGLTPRYTLQITGHVNA
jgi:hypothetical protein